MSFLVGWGQEQKIEKISFYGNRHFSAKVIGGLIASHKKEVFSEPLLANDIEQITGFYVSQGFLKVAVDKTVDEQPSGSVRIGITIREGERTRIAEVSFSGITAFKQKEVLAGVTVRAGQWLIEKALAAAEDTILTFYKNSGYPYVTIQRTVDTADSLARIIFNITEGKLVYIKSVQVWGNKKVATAVILAATEIRPGERFSLQRIYDAQRRLTATGLFQPVNCRPLGFEEKADSVVLSFDVHEQPPHSIGFGLGYETPNRLLFSLDWEFLNFFNQGHVLSLAGEFSPDFYGEYTSNFYINYRIPYILRSKMNFTLSPFFTREVTDDSSRTKTFSTNSWGAEAGTSHDLTKEWRVFFLGRYKVVQTQLDTMTGNTNSLIGGVVYDTRSDPFNPRRGVYLAPAFEAAGGPFRGNNDFYRMTCEGRGFYSIFAARVKVGAILPYGRTAIVPTYEQFTMGGGNSLRGYKDKSIGPVVVDTTGYHYGNCFVNTTLEIRSPFYKNFGVVLFSDGGEMTLTLGEFTRSQFEYSAGVGLRYNTPIGPVRVDYGRQLKNLKSNGWGIYLGLFQVF